VALLEQALKTHGKTYAFHMYPKAATASSITIGPLTAGAGCGWLAEAVRDD